MGKDKEAEEAAMMEAKMEEEEKKKTHKFWGTQPVRQFGVEEDKDKEEGPIDAVKTIEEVRQEPLNLAEGFEWFNPDITDADVLENVYNLLADHYVEDDDQMFRFCYPRDFLMWALTPPGWVPDWHIGVRVAKSKKIVGFITGVPARISLRGTMVDMAEINFLCVHKLVRSKRLAPVLIKEVTRRVNLTGVWQAVYTAGVVLPRPVTRCQYWHRSLNPLKLIDIKFSALPRQFQKLQRPRDATEKHFQLPNEPELSGIRKMDEGDVGAVTELLNKYLEKFPFHPHFSEKEVHHWLLPRDEVISAYVIEKEGKITDFISFYCLPSTVINNEKHSHLKAAYSFYNVANSVSIQVLLNQALILAKKEDFDVFNALDLMDNKEAFANLKFGVGDGQLQYYLYNWRLHDIKPQETALVLL